MKQELTLTVSLPRETVNQLITLWVQYQQETGHDERFRDFVGGIAQFGISYVAAEFTAENLRKAREPNPH